MTGGAFVEGWPNRDMRLEECQKCWCAIGSSGGHSADYAWC